MILLVKIIEAGLNIKDETQINFLNAVNKEWMTELTGIKEDVLQKAGLTEMNEKLIGLETK